MGIHDKKKLLLKLLAHALVICMWWQPVIHFLFLLIKLLSIHGHQFVWFNFEKPLSQGTDLEPNSPWLMCLLPLLFVQSSYSPGLTLLNFPSSGGIRVMWPRTVGFSQANLPALDAEESMRAKHRVCFSSACPLTGLSEHLVFPPHPSISKPSLHSSNKLKNQRAGDFSKHVSQSSSAVTWVGWGIWWRQSAGSTYKLVTGFLQ